VYDNVAPYDKIPKYRYIGYAIMITNVDTLPANKLKITMSYTVFGSYEGGRSIFSISRFPKKAPYGSNLKEWAAYNQYNAGVVTFVVEKNSTDEISLSVEIPTKGKGSLLLPSCPLSFIGIVNRVIN
jgi:hypothetical protein